MKKRKIGIFVLGISIAISNMNYVVKAKEVIPKESIILQKNVDQTLTENISEGVLKKEETEISDKEILANVLPVEKSKLKGESLQEVEDVINLSGVNALSAADSLNQIEDEIAYEVALHELRI